MFFDETTEEVLDDPLAYLWLKDAEKISFPYGVAFEEQYVSVTRIVWCNDEGVKVKLMFVLGAWPGGFSKTPVHHIYNFTSKTDAAKFVLFWGGEVLEPT